MTTGKLVPLAEPYPGSNLFSLASGGAIYVRDPGKYHGRAAVERRQVRPLTDADWELILPYLEENERLFGINVEQLLTVNGKQRKPAEVYRKVVPGSVAASPRRKPTMSRPKNCSPSWPQIATEINVITITKTEAGPSLKRRGPGNVRRELERLLSVQEMLQRLSGGNVHHSRGLPR